MALRKPKTKADFFKLEHLAWDQLNAPIKGLSKSAWAQPGASGDWTLKDVWAHLADWMIETRRVLPTVMRGRKVPINIPLFNAKHYRKNQSMPLPIARQRLAWERKRFLSLAKNLSEEQLLGNRRVYNWVSYSTYNHYVEHIPNLVRFGRKMRLEKQK